MKLNMKVPLDHKWNIPHGNGPTNYELWDMREDRDVLTSKTLPSYFCLSVHLPGLHNRVSRNIPEWNHADGAAGTEWSINIVFLSHCSPTPVYISAQQFQCVAPVYRWLYLEDILSNGSSLVPSFPIHFLYPLCTVTPIGWPFSVKPPIAAKCWRGWKLKKLFLKKKLSKKILLHFIDAKHINIADMFLTYVFSINFLHIQGFP